MMKKAAYQKILREQKDRVFSYAFYFLKNREDAEDVTQEVFLKVWQHWEKIDKKRIVAWMMRVTYNQCVDVSRKKKAGGNHRSVSGDFIWDKIQSQSTIHTDPESSMEFSETQKALLSAMSALPKKTQSMLLLHYFQGLKYETIGEILDAKLSTVKVTIHRGRKMLRQLLAEEYPERAGKYQNECAV
jgi:RNA polymerase sigma-70 factor (ECF subfamily)